MKISLLLTLATTASAFAPSAVVSKPRALHAASGLGRDEHRSPRLGEISTEPVASKPVSKSQRAAMKDVMIDPDYTLVWSIAALAPLIHWYHPSYFEDGSMSLIGTAGGLFHMLFAALLWTQTRRVRLVFEKDGFQFYNIKGHKLDLENGAYLEQKPDNYVSGTKNKWDYDKVINYGFFPSLEFPVIVYFKETETPEWKWNRWFAAFDSYGRGQPHFFPGICNVHQFKREMEARGVKRKPIPKWSERFQKK